MSVSTRGSIQGMGLGRGSLGRANGLKAFAFGARVGRILPIVIVLAIYSNPVSSRDTKEFRPIGITCPGTNSGVLETLQQNLKGWRERLRFRLDAEGKLKFAELAASEKGENYDVISVNPDSIADDGEAAYAHDLFARAMKMGAKFCGGSAAEWERLQRRLKQNRILLEIE